MSSLTHILLFLLSASVIWVLSGILIEAVDRVARRYNKPGFAVAFIVLGLMTSISEFSVLINSTINDVPAVSAGNLIGASMVITLLLVPLLSMAGGGVPMIRAIRPASYAFMLGIIIVPALIAVDGSVHRAEGLIVIALYATLMYVVRKRKPAEEIAEDVIERTEKELINSRNATAMDLLKIAAGAGLIFVAGNFLVRESVYFAQAMHVPASFIGLMLLAIGTNIPELTIAIRCIMGKHNDIAFGDYLGSAAANSLLFGILVLLNGTFSIESSEVIVALIFLATGLILLYVFGRTKDSISRKEGVVLLALYMFFLIFQIGNAVRISDDQSVDVMHQAAE